MRSSRSIEAGLEATQGLEPFEVPHCRELAIDTARIEDSIRREPRPLVAYHPRSGLRFDPVEIQGADALRRLRDGTLDVAVFDTPSSLPTAILPEVLRALHPTDRRSFPFQLGYIVSPARGETLFHHDGPCHTYNFITEGEKWWWFVEPIGVSQEVLGRSSLTETLTRDGFRHWGRVRVLRQVAGTMVVFPGYWPHRVLTREPSLGLAGYIHVPTARWA